MFRAFPFWDSGPPLPLFLRKNVILKGLERECVQECDSKAVRCVLILQRIDAKGFEAAGHPTRRAFIGDLWCGFGLATESFINYSIEVIECQLVTE
jgi:hypothetical protein